MEIGRRAEDRSPGHKLAAVGEGISAGQVPVRVAQCGSRALSGAVVVGEGEPDGKRFKVGGGIPRVTGNTAVKDSCAGADVSAAVSKRIPGQTNARRYMVPGRGHDTPGNAGVTGKQDSRGSARTHRRLHTWHEGRFLVLRVRGRRL